MPLCSNINRLCDLSGIISQWHVRMVNVLTLAQALLFSEILLLETSARTGENVEDAFNRCAKTIITKIDSGKQLV